MKRGKRPSRGMALGIALVSGAIIHIGSTLAVPRLAKGSAYDKLAAGLPLNTMQVLPPATATVQPLPFVGPDVRLAVCRYDVSQGPVSIAVQLPEKGWSLGLYTRAGDNFHAVPAQDFRKTTVQFTLVPPPEKLLGIFNWGRTADTSASRISVPQPEGLVVLRAPLRGRAYQSETDAVLARAQCAPARS